MFNICWKCVLKAGIGIGLMAAGTHFLGADVTSSKGIRRILRFVSEFL